MGLLWIIGVRPVPGAGGRAGAAPCPVPAALGLDIPIPPGWGRPWGSTRGMGRQRGMRFPGWLWGTENTQGWFWECSRMLGCSEDFGIPGFSDIPGYHGEDLGAAAAFQEMDTLKGCC